VKAALAALRNRRTPLAESSNLAAEPRTASPSRDAFSTPVRQRNTPSDEPVEHAEQAEEDEMSEPVQLEWKLTDEAAMVERAKRTGLLNLASRGLTAVPRKVYSSLIHHSSPFHPSRRRPFDYRTEEQFDFSIAVDNDDDDDSPSGAEKAEGEGAVPWYEQEILKSLNLGNNELEVVGEELGGFEELEFLDLHNNRLTAIPSSLAFLQNLTSLTLSHNRLSIFPLQLLNLVSLRELSLAHNELTSLWPVDWRDQLKEAVQAPNASPSATPEHVDRFADVLGPALGQLGPASSSSPAPPPLPNLKILSLAGNRLGTTLKQPGFAFPARLASLDLSDCGFVDSDVPIQLLGRLYELAELDLSRNQLDDHFPSSLHADSATATTTEALFFPLLEKLHVAVNPIESLEHLEAFLTARVSRPINYFGLPKVVENLVRNQEKRDGRRIGMPVKSDITPLEVDVRECFLRNEQARRRALFPPTASSLARDRAERLQRARGGPHAGTSSMAENGSQEVSRPASPGVPISPTSSTFDPHFVQASTVEGSSSDSPSTPTRRRQVVLEAWEIEAAAGLSTPAGRSMDESVDPPPYSPRSPPRSSSPVPSPAVVLAPTLNLANGGGSIEDDAQDAALALVLSSITRTAGKVSINLASRALSTLPPRCSRSSAASGSNELATVTHIDCSQNQLTKLPCAILHGWQSTRALRVLDLSRNRLATLDLLSTAAENDNLFPCLEVLDLSSNALPSTVTRADDEAPLLAALASLAPSLSELRLRQNRLTDVSGIENLVTGTSSSSWRERKRRLRVFDLGENRISDLDALCAIADDRIAVSTWRCDELDLGMNEIRQLPPKLGLLPDNLILHLIGNAFRFPKREVYEHAGERRVIPWLRERLQAREKDK
ncbi:L domain-like protein, partial [Rhodotorula sp. JG-1b]